MKYGVRLDKCPEALVAGVTTVEHLCGYDYITCNSYPTLATLTNRPDQWDCEDILGFMPKHRKERQTH